MEILRPILYKRHCELSGNHRRIFVGCDENGLKTSTLDFGEDGSYMAYVVDEDAEIGAHYKKVADFKHWLKIYDDDELTYRVNAQEINIYRAGDFGCIIQTIGKH